MTPDEAARFARDAFHALRNDDNAVAMAAYMKTTCPFFGVSAPQRKPTDAAIAAAFRRADATTIEAAVLALWCQRERELKYSALNLAIARARQLGPGAFALYERLIREGGWWDLVDGPAVHLVGGALLADPDALEPRIDAWLDDEDMWIRRTAIIARNRHRDRTDAARLFDACARRAHEREFFIRKAIGWALREYARTDADAVRAFVDAQGDRLSGLSRREALKHVR